MMDKIPERKLDVSKKLDKELHELSNLRDVLGKSTQVADNVANILNSFEDRLAKLETTILPVYQQTRDLQRRQYNTDVTLQALDHVISYYNVAGQVKGMIRDRPGSVGISQYLESMDKLYAACKYFKESNPQSVELENVTSLFKEGTKNLSSDFRDELKNYQKAVPPYITLELVNLEENEVYEDTANSGWELIPPGAREDLRAIAVWLDKHTDSDRLTVYAKLRSDALSSSLQALRDYQRSNSAERVLQNIGGGNSPALRTRVGNAPTPKGRARYPKQLALMLHKMKEGHPPTSIRRQGLPSSMGEDGLEDNDVFLYLTQVTALHRLTYAELQLAQQLVPEDRVTRTFEIILRAPMDKLVADGEVIANQASVSVARGDLQAVLSILALLRHMMAMQPEYDRLLYQCHTSIKSKFAAIINMLQNSCVKALDWFVDNVKNDGEKALPKDGTVHEVTSNAIIFQEQLLEYAPTLAPMLQRDSVAVATGTLEQAKALLGGYIKRVLANLGLTLVNRSEAYSDPTLKAIFRLNNYNYILKTLYSSNIIEYVSMVQPDCEKLYNDKILEQKSLYTQSWNRVLNYLSVEEGSLMTIQSGKLRDKERQLLKDKFSGFNKEIEEMQKVQRSYSIPDIELRESLKRDNKEYILPKYQAFYDKFGGVNFSKYPEKYVRYSPADISYKIDEFFDVAA